jgi:Secretion system C-terminal sorting domain
MKTTYRFSLVQITILCLTLLGNALTAQNRNIAPPGVGGNQNKFNAPALLSLNNFGPSSTTNIIEPPITNALIINQTIWDGSTWSNGFPDASTKAVITANFESADIIEAYSIEISEGATFTLHAGGMLKLHQPISENTKSKLNLLDGAGLLIKTVDARNPNSVLATFTRFNVRVNQYTGLYMSSPVTGQDIGGTNSSTAQNQSKYTSAGYVNILPTEIMFPGIGYTETGDGNGNYTEGGRPSQGGFNHPQTYNGTENTSSTYPISLNGAGGYNLVGNPYSSYLDADSFLQDPSNTGAGTMYFWTHNTLQSTSGNGSGVYRFTSNDFATYNLLGGVNAGKDISAGGSSGTNNYDIPDGKIAFGTGFFLLGSGSATFKTTMTTSVGSQIFRTSGHHRVSSPNALIPPPARHRIWLNLNSGSSYRQTMIGYATGATTTGTDIKFDSPTIDQTSSQPNIDFYSLASGSTTKLAIQGYNLSAMQNIDSFQLGYKTNGGSFTITSTSDGMFTTKPYYILDADDTTVQYHTLPYTFTTSLGTFNNRLKVVFENLISITYPVNICNSQLTNIDSSVFSTLIPGATAYKYEVRTGSDTGPVLGEFNGPNPANPQVFNLNLPSFTTYNTDYWVRVATYKIGTAWQYGPPCKITTPTTPLPSNITTPTCGTTLPSYWTVIRASTVNGLGIAPTNYQFVVTLGANQYTLISTNPSFQLPNVSGLPIIANTTYTIRVDVLWNGNLIVGTTTCNITTPNTAPRQSQNGISIFEASTYPNPFNDNFKLDINTSSDNEMQLFVFDMLGRQIEAKTFQMSDLNNLEVGTNYASGVYNLIIKQADNTKTLRVIKR